MKKGAHERSGIHFLVRKYREMFRIPENLNYYSKKDYRVAERKFLKYAIMEGRFKKI